MKKNKIALLSALVLLGALALGACKKDTETTEATSQETTAAESTTAAAAAEELITVPEKPDNYGSVTLGEYKGLEINVLTTSVSEEEIESELNYMLSIYPSREEITDRTVEYGDIVNIDYTGKKDGVAFEGGTDTGFDLEIGSGRFIEGFEDGLVGAAKGETKDLNLVFPVEYHNADLAGAAVVFTVTVNGIYKEIPAELTDAWVEKTTEGRMKTVEEYRADTRSSMEENKKISSESAAREEVLKKSIENATFEVAPEALEYEKASQIFQIQTMSMGQAMTFEDFASMYGMTKEELEADIAKYAEDLIKRKLVVEEVVKAEGLTVGDAEYAYLEQMQGQPIDAIRETYGEELVEEVAREYMVTSFLLENAKKTEVESITAE